MLTLSTSFNCCNNPYANQMANMQTLAQNLNTTVNMFPQAMGS